MKALKKILGALLIPAIIMVFSKAEDSAVWLQLLSAVYLVGYVCIKFRGVEYE